MIISHKSCAGMIIRGKKHYMYNMISTYRSFTDRAHSSPKSTGRARNKNSCAKTGENRAYDP